MRSALNQTKVAKPEKSDGAKTWRSVSVVDQARAWRAPRSTFSGAHNMKKCGCFDDNSARNRVALARKARLAAICLLMAASLSGCGVFCGAAGGSGGGVAGGCGAGMRF